MKKVLFALLLFMLIFSCGCTNISVINKQDNQKTNEYLLKSDSEIVTEVDLSKLNDTELRYALEEIYARHGKVFSDANYEKYFNSKSWYTPDPSFNENSLSALEKENADYIIEYINNHSEKTSTADTSNSLSKYDEDYYYSNYRGDNTYIVPDSSVRRLTVRELSGCSPTMLALIRNEIYARNGYIFQKQKYKDYFSSKAWYSPDPNFNESFLNDIEKYNIQLIKSME